MNSCITHEVERYIVAFLLGEDNYEQSRYIYYRIPNNEDKDGVFIVPSLFFDENNYLNESSLPEIDGESIDGVRILFGSSKVEIRDHICVLYADYIASTFFAITRYEEYIRRDCRDNHGRMIGRKSVIYKTGLLQLPFVEEYGYLLRSYLRKIGIECKEPKQGFSNVYMTHDIDKPWTIKMGLRNRIREILSDTKAILLNNNRQKHIERLSILSGKKDDPIDTFAWFIEKDSLLKKSLGDKSMSLYFLMTCNQGHYDYGYFEDKKRTKELVDYLMDAGAEVGLHISYQAGDNPELIENECRKYEEFIHAPVRASRHHYLMCREPEDMEFLIKNGIKDDFSCCFADVAGFRLGTCRPVNWINPKTMEVTNLVLHPLFLTETKIMNPDFMGLTYSEAKEYIRATLRQIGKWAGEVVVLFHNTSVIEAGEESLYMLYDEMIDMILDMCN